MYYIFIIRNVLLRTIISGIYYHKHANLAYILIM